MKLFAFSLREYDEKAYLEKICNELNIDYGYTPDYPSLDNLHLAKGYDAVSIITNPINKEMLDLFKDYGIKAISTRSIGYDHIDCEYAKSIGIKICNVSYSPNSVANYTIMMILMACRKIDYIMKKAACRIFPLMETAAESDIISLHVPGFPENHHMINKDSISKMKDGVIIVNAARGMLINTGDLVDGLNSGKIGYAALDTFENEKGLYYLSYQDKVLANKDFHLLNGMPNVMLSPHMAFYTDEAVSDMVGNSVKGLLSAVNGEKSPFIIE